MLERIILTPIHKFVKIESLSGFLLFSATLIALIWANSSWSESYHDLWNFKLGFSSDSFDLTKPLILWINDGLMGIFFFLIGLEIKRELMIGELNTLKKAALPLSAAIGGMLIPMTFYFILNSNPNASHGWGIPMATDIAFSLAILKLLGNRVPLSLKIFLTAFAIVDDIGAVLVIAIFYSEGIKWMLLLYAIILLAILFFLAHRGLYEKFLFLAVGGVIWLLFLKSGIHPTVAGVLMALTIPIRQKINVKTYTRKLGDIADKIREAEDSSTPILTIKQIHQIDNMEDWTRRVQSPLQYLEHRLHNVVSFFVMPVFGLANAGISFGSSTDFNFPLVLTIALSLIFGKLIGVSLFTFIGVKLKITDLPDRVRAWQVIGISLLAGVGFTMSIFIATLAFASHPELMDSAKAGILAGSVFAGLAGYTILRLISKKGAEEESEEKA